MVTEYKERKEIEKTRKNMIERYEKERKKP